MYVGCHRSMKQSAASSEEFSMRKEARENLPLQDVDKQHREKSVALWGINKYFCVSLQGGVNDEVTLAAYITIALLEIPLPVTVRVRTPT